MYVINSVKICDKCYAISRNPCNTSGAARISVPAGGTFKGVVLVGAPRGRAPPPDARYFENFQKNSEESCQKWIILGDFSKKIKKPCVTFSRFRRKIQLCGKFLRKSSKISLKNAQKMLYFGLFSK